VSTLRIDVHFDLICPWCFIGKAHLRAALARLAGSDPAVRAQVHWHSVQLIPNVPDHGWLYAEFYERRLGGKDAVRARQAQVNAAATHAGVAIEFARIAIFPNTARGHRLVALAQASLDAAGQERLLDRLFAAYFQRGEDIGDVRTLTAIAAEQGLEPDATRAALVSTARVPGPHGIDGVPHFVFNERHALSGAHPAEVLHAAMREAVEHAH
jgi:predicted DsbA family dithiol-disulfide isomerase